MIDNLITINIAMLDDLTTFIKSNPDPRELKRAIAVQMWNNGYKHQEIQDNLSVSSGFISKWTQRYQEQGIVSLKLAHRGSLGYLDPEQRATVIQWIQEKDYWHLSELQTYLENEYDVIFKSKQSYYNLFDEAGLSWKKSQKYNPKTDPEVVKKNN
jgi:putative transposase